ncbi:hypothetical protein [Macrococcus carouselicus]|uniref:Uncharacterized protein n=1 Tax=Macrococcus carouselicus TaxID=69969 RepID=A0A9Q8CKD4_9STAP|nr:hypothetical protein [Macrococcus carouselicus]TDM03836.1 hypothetical protein ERX40_01340 [Macrococcus carouselicus]
MKIIASSRDGPDSDKDGRHAGKKRSAACICTYGYKTTTIKARILYAMKSAYGLSATSETDDPTCHNNIIPAIAKDKSDLVLTQENGPLLKRAVFIF